MNDNDLAKALEKAVRYYNVRVTAYLNQGDYPTGQDAYRSSYKPIQDTANIHDPVKSGNQVSQTITYGSNKEAPYAVAYEYGSGEHGLGGEKYTIRAKGKPLAVGKANLIRGRRGWIPVNRVGVFASKKFISLAEYGGDDIYLFSYVEHPGIAARPYAQPVLDAEQDNITQIIGNEVFASVVLDIKQL